jgi:hypothetical protein
MNIICNELFFHDTNNLLHLDTLITLTYLYRLVYAKCQNQLVDGVSKGMYTLREHTV